MIIGDFMGVLYTVIAVLGVLLACYGAALFVSFRASRPRQTAKGVQPATSADVPQTA